MNTGNSSKYNFDDVLVADSRLLMSMEDVVTRPQIIVLNNKLNVKCNKQANNSNTCYSSTTCCLQVEEPEFKRRSDMIIVEADLSKHRCFANCGDRRKIDIELNARSQLSGRVVVLALTRINHWLPDDRINKPNPLRCDTETTWAYSRFEPVPQTVNKTLKQTHYSLLKYNQAPSLLINTVGLNWNLKKLKESVSLAVQSNRSRKNLQIVTTETLLIIQLQCQPTTFSSKNWLYDEENPSQPMKIHLLALINRQVPKTLPKTGQTPLLDQSYGKMESSQSGSKNDKNNTELMHSISPESRPELSASVLQASQSKRELANSQFDGIAKATTQTPNINQRVDMISFNSTRGLFLAVPAIGNKLDVRLNDTSSLGSSYLTELDSIRLRLKSSSLLLFTVSSSFVILIYTLCLFIYLKSRRRKSVTPGEMRGSSQVQNNITHTKGSRKEAANHRTSQAINISGPYNLQMPPATRTRLDMMLRAGDKHSYPNDVNQRNFELQRYDGDRFDGSHLRESFDGQLDDIAFKHRLEDISDRSAHHELEDTIYGEICNFDDHDHDHDHHHHQRSPSSNKSQLANGTNHVMRVIQQAATLARSRLRGSRYHPNLNAIPECEAEYQQSLPSGSSNYLESRFSPNRNDNHQHHRDRNNRALPAAPVPPEGYNSLIQNAMSQDCSHNVKKIYRQPTTTLLSKPCELVTTGPPVSRSRILRQVKKEELYAEHSRDVKS